MNRIYIKAATQISMQQPLSEEWMTAPLEPAEPYLRSVDPNFREWLNPLESRRMGKIMKRALVTALKVMRDTAITQPDAIITGTGLGCIENTELFLDQLIDKKEALRRLRFEKPNAQLCLRTQSHNKSDSSVAIHRLRVLGTNFQFHLSLLQCERLAYRFY